MLVRILIGNRAGQIQDMKYADAQRLIAAGHAELPDALRKKSAAVAIQSPPAPPEDENPGREVRDAGRKKKKKR